jgi:hypothetical protein
LKKKALLNKSVINNHNEKEQKEQKLNDFLNRNIDPILLSKIKKSNLNHSEQDEEKNSDINISDNKILNNMNKNSKIINNNKNQILTNFYNNVIGNGIGNNNNKILNINKIEDYNSYNYNRVLANNINNYNLINKIQKDLNIHINNGNYNNIYLSLCQNLINNKNNYLNNFNMISNLNQINSNMINTINVNNINNINGISNIRNNNIILNPININISNIEYFNGLNHIKNNINSLNIIKKNLLENNINNNNFVNNVNNVNNSFLNNSSNNNDNFFPINDNDKNKILIVDFLKYIKSLTMPLVNFLCTTKGTLEIQKKLGRSNECKILLIKLLNKEGLTIIMKNTYGNYFFQQIIKGAEEIIISLILSFISDNFIDISKDPSGTFSVQALLNEISSIKDEQQILNCIKNHEMEMTFNKNATYVIQKIVLLFPDIHRIYLNEIILNNFKDLCLDCNGICLIKNFIKTNTILNNKKRINEEIVKHFVVLAESPFGNYGIQYLMENWNKNEFNDMKTKILENLHKLSVQQYSSNVVEKAIEIFDDETRELIIKKLYLDDNFIVLLKNKFGRFVLNKAINYMDINLKNQLELILINNIKNNIYSNKDKIKVKKFLMKIKNNKYQKNNNIDLDKEYCIRNNLSNFCNYFNYGIENCEKNN